MTIFWKPEGPYIHHNGGDKLTVEDLNPERIISWRVTRGEMWRIGLRFLLAAWRAKP